MQPGTVERGHLFGFHAFADVAGEQGGEFGLVRGEQVGQSQQADAAGGVGRGGIEHGGDAGFACHRQGGLDGLHR